MKITELDIDRFRIWRSLLLKLNPSGLNVIYGPNEAGKTTLDGGDSQVNLVITPSENNN